jgi:hypothetical protein
MAQISKIVNVLIILLLACFIISIAAGTENGSDFEELKNDPNFIASRGTIPEVIDQEWENSVSKCWLNITTKSYRSDIHASMLHLSCAGHFLIVELDPGYEDKIDESAIDKIYQKIDRLCEQEGVGEMPVVFMWPYDAPSPLPDYGPDVLEAAKKDPQFIASRGTMPIITDEGEKRAWIDLLVQCTRNNKEIDQYFISSGGSVESFGSYIDGYLRVGLYSYTSEKVNESVINEIYKVIREQGEKEGINDVPVVFMWSQGEVTLDEAIVETAPAPDEGMLTIMDENGNYIDVHPDEVDIDEDGNYVLKDNSTAKQSPGFTSVMFALSLFSMAGRKKK